MILYHGTSEKRLKSIKKNGIKPRGKDKSNWDEYPSRDDMVYLSLGFAPYFAMTASESKKDRGVVIELDVSMKNLYPDEDYLAQRYLMDNPDDKYDLQELTAIFSGGLLSNKKFTKDSIELLGNCAHKGKIPVSKLIRYTIIDTLELIRIYDPIVNITANMILKDRNMDIVENQIWEHPLSLDVGYF